MEFTEHRCKNCGGQLHQIEDNRWKCRHCTSVFDDNSAAKHTEEMSKLFDNAKLEAINNLRRNLYDATHAEYISSTDILTACTALKQYLPDDFQANFYSVAASSNVKHIAKAIRKIDVEKNLEHIEGVIQFLIRSLQSEYLLELNNLIERTYRSRDLSKFEKYATELSIESEKVELGLYETRLPRHAFIAYSSKDMDKVSELVEVIEAHGLKCFVAARNLRHGKGAVENYNKALEEAMDHCTSFVFVSSLNSRSLSCDALEIELPYIQSKDINNAPAEMRNNYAAIPQRFKKPRVEYMIQESKTPNVADSITCEFFDGYERVYSPDEVAMRIAKQLIASANATAEPVQTKYTDMEQKKICSACGAENNVNTKFCGECGGNEFVNSVSEFIKLRKLKEDAEKAKNDAAIAEAERARQAALREAEKAKQEAEAKLKAAESATAAMKAAEQKAKEAEDERRRAALARGAYTNPTSTYSSGSSSSSSYSSSTKSKKSSIPKVVLIPGAILVTIALILTIIGEVMNKSEDKSTDGSNNNSNISDVGGDYSEYPNFTFANVAGGLSVSVDPEKAASLSGALEIPSSVGDVDVVEIPKHGFKGCTGITSVSIPSTVKTIGNGAFSGCSNIAEITIPHVGEKPTSETPESQFGYIFGTDEYAGGVATKQFYGNSSGYYRTFYLPAKLTTVTVTDATSLSYAAFNNCANLKTINLTEAVILVGDRVFEGCTSLTTVSLPNITEISSRMFYGCTALESFEIGEKVSAINGAAFKGCSSLSRINSTTDGEFIIANNVKSIGDGAFAGCTRLTAITIPFVGNTPTSTEPEGHFGYIFGTDEYAGGIATKQFYGNSSGYYRTFYLPNQLSKVTVTNATSLVYGAFNNCSELTEINLNDGIIGIGERAFEGCSSIKSINLPSIKEISNRAFLSCSSLESYNINSNVITIGEAAFKNCTGLKRINSDIDGEFIIPTHVKNIKSGAFAGCSQLTSISIPFVGAFATATGTDAHFGYIFGKDELAGTTGIRQNYDTSTNYYYTYYIPSRLTDVTVTGGTSLAFGAFHNCTMLDSINLHDGIMSADDWAFRNCSGITELNLPNLTTISTALLSGCTSLESFEIGNKVTTIEDSAFAGCIALKRINSSEDGTFYIKNNVKTIGDGAFSGCIKLESIILPFLGRNATEDAPESALGYIFGTSEYMGGTATKQYYGSSNNYYRTFYIPSGLKYVTLTHANGIDFGAFSSCSMLEKITLNKSLEGKKFGDRAFENCSAEVVYEDYTP